MLTTRVTSSQRSVGGEFCASGTAQLPAGASPLLGVAASEWFSLGPWRGQFDFEEHVTLVATCSRGLERERMREWPL